MSLNGGGEPLVEIEGVTKRYGGIVALDGVSATVRERAVGQAAASQAVGFTVKAPATLAGLPQHQVRAIGIGSHHAALATYGRGLGTVFLLEQRASGSKSPLSSLPSVSIAGSKGHELDTTLGSVIQWSRGGVTYTIAGSQSAQRLLSAAESLA